MKPTRKGLGLILVTSLLLGGAGTALAFGDGHHGKGHCDSQRGSPMRALDRLESLSDAQREQLRGIVEQQRESMQTQKESMRASHRELRSAMRDGLSGEPLRELAERQGEQVTAMIMARAELRGKIHSVLTEAQRTELKEMRQQKRHWGQRRQ